MGAMAFVGLVLCVLIVLGFMIYGVFLGLGTLGRLLKGLWPTADHSGPDRAEGVRGGGGEGLCCQSRAGRGCWEAHECPEGTRASCPARQRPDLPCWLANMQASGDYKLKPECLACKLFNIPALMTGL